MPTYKYECKACKLEFDVDQKITEDKLTTHLNVDGITCGPVERLIAGSVNFTFKGGAPTPKTYN